MIQTKVKEIGAFEHEVQVEVPQTEYDRIYASQLKRLGRQAKLPGFRPGKAPSKVIEEYFGDKLQEDTIGEIIQQYYLEAVESTGLKPAVQPDLEVPVEQPESGFVFSMKITTWPTVELNDLSVLKFDRTIVQAEDADVDSVVERLRQSQVRFEAEKGRAAELGDQVRIDFVGYLDDEPFEGGRGEDVALVLGEGRFIPGFEEQIVGKKAGEEFSIEVSFPENYQASHLAGQKARFDIVLKEVSKPVKSENDDELAKMLGFDDAAALRKDIRSRLELEAEKATYIATRQAVFDALLEAYDIDLPEALVAQDMLLAKRRIIENMKHQGVEADEEMFADEEFQKELRNRSVRSLKLSVIMQAVRDIAGANVEDAEIDEEIDRQSAQHPEERRDQFKAWVRGQPEQLEAIREQVLERKCIDYLVANAKVSELTRTLSDWQKEQEISQQV